MHEAAASETFPVDINTAVEMSPVSTKPCSVEIPGYELNESPYSVTDMLVEVGDGEGDPFR